MSKRGKSGKSKTMTKKASKRVQSATDDPKKPANDQGWKGRGQPAADTNTNQGPTGDD